MAVLVFLNTIWPFLSFCVQYCHFGLFEYNIWPFWPFLVQYGQATTIFTNYQNSAVNAQCCALIYFILKNKKGLVFSRQIKRHSVHNNLGLIIVVIIVVRSAVAQW